MKNFEQTIMKLIVHAGEARSAAIQAIREAREDNLNRADELIKICKEENNKAHDYQTKLIAEESNGVKMPNSLLLIHAQDHVMNALTIKDIAIEFVETIKKFKK